MLEAKSKSLRQAYLLLIFLGHLGAHQFFLGNIRRAILFIIFSLPLSLCLSTSLHRMGTLYLHDFNLVSEIDQATSIEQIERLQFLLGNEQEIIDRYKTAIIDEWHGPLKLALILMLILLTMFLYDLFTLPQQWQVFESFTTNQPVEVSKPIEVDEPKSQLSAFWPQLVQSLGWHIVSIKPDLTLVHVIKAKKAMLSSELKTLPALLAHEEEDYVNQVLSALMSAWGEPLIQFEINQHLLPDRVVLDRDKVRQILSLRWLPILTSQEDGAEVIYRILLVVSDITDQQTLETKMTQQSEHITRIGQLIAIDQGDYERFNQNLSEGLQHMASCSDPSNDSEAKRILHSLKGNARFLGLKDIAEKIHLVEDHLNDAHAKEKLQLVINDYQSLARKIFPQTKINRYGHSDLSAAIAFNLRTSQVHSGSEFRYHKIIHDFLIGAISVESHRLVSNLQRAIDHISQESNTKPPLLTWNADTVIRFSKPAYDALLVAFSQLCLNSLSHCFLNEPPSTGYHRIDIQCHSAETGLVIYYQDSGDGLDLKTILEKSSLPPSANDQEIAECLFAGAITTKKEVSLNSGRGWGLASAQHELADIGAHIAVEFMGQKSIHGTRPFKFVIHVPHDHIYLKLEKAIQRLPAVS